MKILAKYWKVLLAVLLAAAAVYIYLNTYKTEKAEFESKTANLGMMILALEGKIQENAQYADIQDELEDAKLALEASRMDLYKSFPVEMKEEDQIMYVLYLETLFKEEIFFSFAEPIQLVPLQDGSNLQGMLITVNYKTTYDGFQNMVKYLSTDSRVVSVYESTIDYDAQNDVATGYLTLLLYLLDTDKMEYVSPDVAIPETGKNNIFG